jgi:hypothetical protein
MHNRTMAVRRGQMRRGMPHVDLMHSVGAMPRQATQGRQENGGYQAACKTSQEHR